MYMYMYMYIFMGFGYVTSRSTPPIDAPRQSECRERTTTKSKWLQSSGLSMVCDSEGLNVCSTHEQLSENCDTLLSIGFHNVWVMLVLLEH